MSGRAPAIDLPPHVLREYAVLADGERGAVVGPRGDVVWLCVPYWHSGSVFSALIGGSGAYTITPTSRHVWGGYYEGASMIWRSRWVTGDGIVECREALAFPADPHRAVLLRRVCAVDCDTEVAVELRPRADYDRAALRDLHREDGVWTGAAGDLRLRWNGAPDARPADNGEVLRTLRTVRLGEQHDFVLELSDQPLPDEPLDASAAWRATERAWADEVPMLDTVLDPDSARHGYAVLRGMTSHGGGMVAAATTSLPERADAGRNYDYRYVWIRDQSYAGHAMAACGATPLLDDAVSFVSERLLEHGAKLAPAYTTTGEPVPDQRELGLPGYPGGSDLVGNWVNQQFQLDGFGEALLLLASAGRLDRLDAKHWSAVEVAAGAISKRWNEPDAGIWELDNRAWTHSRLIASAGLRAVAALAPAGEQAADWLACADRILADTTAHGLHPSGYWKRAADDEKLDAALLLAGLRGAVPPDDPRTNRTLRAYLDELTSNGYAYRFRHDDRPLRDAEGSFLLCGFLVALALHQHGDEVEARAWHERTRAACGPPALFSEEFDAQQHQMRGNLPQAFVHALYIESSARLHRQEVP